MNLSAVLIPAFLCYLALLYCLALRFKLLDVWRGNDTSTVALAGKGLTRLVKRILDILLVFFVAVFLIWPVVIIVMAVAHNSISTWGIDISVFSGFKIDIDALSGVEVSGLRNPELSGKTMVAIDTSNLTAWYLFAIISELSAIAVIYCLVQLRPLVISLKNGLSFAAENAARIKKVGVVVLVWYLTNPFLQYFVWGDIIKEITFSSEGIQLYPAFEVSGIGIIVGLMLILLSGILREASDLSVEQELTI